MINFSADGSFYNDIESRGYTVIPNALNKELIADLMADCYRINPHFSHAGIGRLNHCTTLNRTFFMGLFDYECHYAKYTHGDFYKKHVDAFKGRSNRVFTSVLYLNTPNEGGELVIYKPKSKVVEVSISPKAGTLVLFESERFVHEVLPAVDNRYSIAGWFRKNASISGIVDPPR